MKRLAAAMTSAGVIVALALAACAKECAHAFGKGSGFDEQRAVFEILRRLFRKRGVDLILGGFLHFQEEIEYFGSRVLPLVREIEESEEDSTAQPVLASL